LDEVVWRWSGGRHGITVNAWRPTFDFARRDGGGAGGFGVSPDRLKRIAGLIGLESRGGAGVVVFWRAGRVVDNGGDYFDMEGGTAR